MNKIRQLRKEQNKPVSTLAKILGITPKHFYDLETGKRRLHEELIRQLAEIFGVSADYLLGYEDGPKSGSPAKIPLLGTVRAGIPLLAEGNWDGEVEIAPGIRADFALEVKGDSMSWAGIHEGDIALLRENSVAEHGMIVAAGLEEEEWTATLKYYVKEKGRCLLRPANPGYEDIELVPGHRIIGQVISVKKEPPPLTTYREMLVSKEILDEKWARARETATRYGMDGERVQSLIELFSHLAQNV